MIYLLWTVTLNFWTVILHLSSQKILALPYTAFLQLYAPLARKCFPNLIKQVIGLDIFLNIAQVNWLIFKIAFKPLADLAPTEIFPPFPIKLFFDLENCWVRRRRERKSKKNIFIHIDCFWQPSEIDSSLSLRSLFDEMDV